MRRMRIIIYEEEYFVFILFFIYWAYVIYSFKKKLYIYMINDKLTTRTKSAYGNFQQNVLQTQI